MPRHHLLATVLLLDAMARSGTAEALAWLLAACLALAASGCTHDRSELYASGGELDSGMHDAGETVTAERAATEIFGADCAACVAETCATEISDCAASAECAEGLLCRQRCDDPACHAECEAAYPLEERPSSPLEQCAVGCAGECGVGRDFACAGRYRWPDPEQAEQVMKLELREFWGMRALSGIRVRVCEGGLLDPACASWHSEVQSGADGRVEVTLPSGRGANTSRFKPFDGFLQFDDPEDPPRVVPTLMLAKFSVARPYEHWFVALLNTPDSVQEQEALAAEVGLPARVAGMGHVMAVIFDCKASNNARGFGLTVSVDSPNDGTVYGTTAETSTNLSGFAQILNVTPGPAVLTALDGGEEVLRYSIPVRADTTTYLWLFPQAIQPPI